MTTNKPESKSDVAKSIAERIYLDGIGDLTPIQSADPTLRSAVARALGAGQYISFWHDNRYVFIMRDHIDNLLAVR